jgi:chitinase
MLSQIRTWDSDNPIGNQILGHTNLTEIDMALDLLWRNDVSPSKIVLGTGFYGRSFRLENPTCWTPGCKFSGPGEKGECTATEGFLSYKEVKDILAKTKAKPKLDKEAAVQYLTYGQNSWISYDDPSTIQLKVDFANKRGLKGLMTWAIDIDDEKGDLIRALTGKEMQEGDDVLQFMTDDGPSIAHGTADGTKCKISECGKDGEPPKCDTGYTMVGRANTDINGKNRCNTKKSAEARKICCPSFAGPQENDCRWDWSHSNAAKTDCSAKCKVGEINVINDSFGWTGDLVTGSYDWQCKRGWKSFCCKAGNMERYLKICDWTKCGGTCPSDKPFELTTDTGGPKENTRCSMGSSGGGSPFDGPVSEENNGMRRLCCPRKDSFGNCNWESSKVCSSTCALGKITLDLDPRGPSPSSSSCHNGREQVSKPSHLNDGKRSVLIATGILL